MWPLVGGRECVMKIRIILTLALLLISGIAGVGGYGLGLYRGHQAEATAQKVARQQALLEQQARLQTEYQQRVDQANAAVTALRAENAQISQRETALQEQIRHVTTQYRRTPHAPVEPLPGCVFTRGFVRVYNRAIGADSVPATGVAAAADGEARATSTADTLSDINRTDILNNVVANGSRCQRIENQLNTLIDYLNTLQETH